MPLNLLHSPFHLTLTTILFAFVLTASSAAEEERQWFERQTEWNGYQQHHFRIAERPAYVVTPKQVAGGNPWVWRARFPGYHAEMDLELLARGYHIGYVNVAELFGNPQAIEIGNQFYEFMTNERGLAAKPALEGVSRGGLFVYNWAAANPQRVACIYCDTPVCDIKSWPGGKGSGLGSEPTWQKCLQAYGLTEQQALVFDQNPIDHAKVIADAKIPLLHIVSENDRVVPPQENTYVLKQRLEQHGQKLEIISVAQGTEKSNGHHFTHPEPNRVVNFITQHTQLDNSQRMRLLRNAKRIVFLGDSITYAGQYVSLFDTWLSTQSLATPPAVINVGLPSETVSGLSEDGHAGGRFPRPDLAERLTRALAITQPDIVFACYGINCGIYQPFDEQRFQLYQQGIINLKETVEAAGATLILITPPCFDDQRAKKAFAYNDVLDRYSKWLVTQRNQGWLVVDLHGPMSQELVHQRKSHPDFTFQPDAVHPNDQGHQFIASQLIRWFGGQSDQETSETTRKAVRQRMNVRRDAYLATAGHKRPGIKPGLSIQEAERQAAQLTKAINRNDNVTPQSPAPVR